MLPSDIPRKRIKTKRTQIALRNPSAQQMWQEGYSLSDIARALGRDYAAHGSQIFGPIDPTPQPLGCPPYSGLAGETGEMRAWRRFPIAGHKPG